jgi:hypothetical protein
MARRDLVLQRLKDAFGLDEQRRSSSPDGACLMRRLGVCSVRELRGRADLLVYN